MWQDLSYVEDRPSKEYRAFEFYGLRRFDLNAFSIGEVQLPGHGDGICIGNDSFAAVIVLLKCVDEDTPMRYTPCKAKGTDQLRTHRRVSQARVNTRFMHTHRVLMSVSEVKVMEHEISVHKRDRNVEVYTYHEKSVTNSEFERVKGTIRVAHIASMRLRTARQVRVLQVLLWHESEKWWSRLWFWTTQTVQSMQCKIWHGSCVATSCQRWWKF